jgi:hypothetical protein
MRRKGVNYDTGITPFGEELSRVSFDPAQVRREMGVIADDLGCNAVRITGRDAGRIALAAQHALAHDLEVWFSPFPCNLGADELIATFAAHARAAEELRRRSSRVVFVMGCELTMFDRGFIPGDTYAERIQHLLKPAVGGVKAEALIARFQAVLARALAEVRAVFKGPVTYASGPWEPVDWSGFDIVSVDLYRDSSNRHTYRDRLRAYFASGHPVVVTEFGCCTYHEAAARGATGWAIVDRAARPPVLTEAVQRDEAEQARHAVEMVDLLQAAGVDGAFWFTFAGWNYPHTADATTDLDRASYGLVKVLEGSGGLRYPDLPWEPKLAFDALAERYARLR